MNPCSMDCSVSSVKYMFSTSKSAGVVRHQTRGYREGAMNRFPIST
jgi:hypothetical protein